MSAFFLEFLTRRECPLCDEAEEAVAKVGRWTRTEIRPVNVDSAPELAVDFGLRIPVVRGPEGAVLGEGRLAVVPLLRSVLKAKAVWLAGRFTSGP